MFLFIVISRYAKFARPFFEIFGSFGVFKMQKKLYADRIILSDLWHIIVVAKRCQLVLLPKKL